MAGSVGCIWQTARDVIGGWHMEGSLLTLVFASPEGDVWFKVGVVAQLAIFVTAVAVPVWLWGREKKQREREMRRIDERRSEDLHRERLSFLYVLQTETALLRQQVLQMRDVLNGSRVTPVDIAGEEFPNPFGVLSEVFDVTLPPLLSRSDVWAPVLTEKSVKRLALVSGHVRSWELFKSTTEGLTGDLVNREEIEHIMASVDAMRAAAEGAIESLSDELRELRESAGPQG